MGKRDEQEPGMPVERLEAIVRAYGADEQAWPEGERLAASRLAVRLRRCDGLVDAPSDGLVDAPSPGDAQPEGLPERRALAERAARVRDLLREAAAIDELLAADRAVEVPASLRERVVVAAPRLKRARPRPAGPARPAKGRPGDWPRRIWPFSPLWQPVAALAAASVIGVVLGSTMPDASIDGDDPDVSELAFGTDTEWDPNGQWEATWDD